MKMDIVGPIRLVCMGGICAIVRMSHSKDIEVVDTSMRSLISGIGVLNDPA